MNKTFSLYLDLWRGLAAVAIVFHHYALMIQREHSKNAILTFAEPFLHFFEGVGREAVMIFFVLSGFVIAYVIDTRESSLIQFTIRRFARFYSVMLPAIAIALGSFAIQRLVSGRGWLHFWQSMGDEIQRAILSFTFFNYNHFIRATMSYGGGVFWSLTYEFWYYIAIAFIVFVRPRFLGIALAIGVFLLLGMDGLLLWLIWLLGYGTYYLYKSKILEIVDRLGIVAIFVITLIAIYGLCISSLPDFLNINDATGVLNLKYGKSVFYFLLLGAMVATNFLAVSIWSSRGGLLIIAKYQVWIRRLAESSFFLYLTHYNLMYLFRWGFKGIGLPFVFPLVAIAIALWVGPAIDRTKSQYYQGLKPLLPPQVRPFA